VNTESAVKALAGPRIVIGVAAWLAPRQSGRGFGLDPGANEQAPYLARLFGARDVVLGAGTLQATGEARTQWLRIGVAVDAAAAAAALAAGRVGYLPPVAAGLVLAPAIAAVGLGLAALGGADSPPE
jgi:hypothetical protein